MKGEKKKRGVKSGLSVWLYSLCTIQMCPMMVQWERKANTWKKEQVSFALGLSSMPHGATPPGRVSFPN